MLLLVLLLLSILLPLNKTEAFQNVDYPSKTRRNYIRTKQLSPAPIPFSKMTSYANDDDEFGDAVGVFVVEVALY